MALSSASWSALFHGRRLVYTLLLTLSIGIQALGLHMLATVLPSIVAELGGAAIAGLVANTAGLATDISLATVTAAAAWVYRLGIIAPCVLAVLAWRLVWLHQRLPRGTGRQNVRAEY